MAGRAQPGERAVGGNFREPNHVELYSHRKTLASILNKHLDILCRRMT